MDKVSIEMSTEQYKNVHLLLHNLIELTAIHSKKYPHPVNETVHETLKNIKTALEEQLY